MNSKVFGIVVVVVLGTIGFGVSQLLAEDATCGSFESAELSDGGIEHDLAFELAGNTAAWQREAERFATSELMREGSVDPTKPFVVRIVLSKNGESVEPTNPCLQQPMVLVPAEQDLRTYEDGSDETKQAQLKVLLDTRQDQIGTVVDELVKEVSTTDFSDVDDVRLTVLPLWSAVAEPSGEPVAKRVISVLSPLFSNADDCLDGPDVDARELVQDCITFGQLPKINDAAVNVSYVRAVVTTTQQRQRATAMRDALCDLAAVGGCPTTETDA